MRTGSIQKQEDTRSEFYGRLMQGAPLAVFIAAGLYIIYKLASVLALIAVAMLIAVVLRTAVHGLKRLGLGSRLSVVVMILALAGFGAFVGVVIFPRIVREVRLLYTQFPQYIDRLDSLSQNLRFIPNFPSLTDRLTSAAYQGLSSLPTLVTNATAFAAAVVVVVFLALYMSISPGPLVSGALRLVPPRKRERARGLLRTIERRLRGWILGVVVISAFIGVGSGIGLWILGVPLPIAFGLIAGVLNVVPYLGSTIGAVLPALVALAVGGWTEALLVVALFVILNQIEGYVLQPLVMGHEARLHPVTIIISFLILGSLLGIIGGLLAVPAVVIFTTLIDELSPEEDASAK